MSSRIIYSCSGCSSAAQMSNWLAVKIDRGGLAKMSCIAGVGGDVKSLVNQAKQAKTIIGIDGCPLHCVSACLKRHGLACQFHYDLSVLGIKKEYSRDFDPTHAEKLYQLITDDLKLSLEKKQ